MAFIFDKRLQTLSKPCQSSSRLAISLHFFGGGRGGASLPRKVGLAGLSSFRLGPQSLAACFGAAPSASIVYNGGLPTPSKAPMTFESDIDLHASSIFSLRESPESIDMFKGSGYGSSESDNSQRAHKLIDKARALGVAGPLWFIGNSSRYEPESVLFALLSQRNCQGAIKALSNAGASIWPVSLAPSKTENGPSAPRLIAKFMSFEKVARFCFSTDDYPVGSCKACLSSSLSGLASTPPSLHASFFAALAESYDEATASSSATSLGVLGRADKRAKSCSEILASQAAPLRAACAALCPASSPMIEAMIASGAGRLAAKAQASLAAFNPEKLKKSLDDSQKLRLRTISTLIESCPDDEDGLRAVMAATPWLPSLPQALCLRLRSGSSIAHGALRARSRSVLELIDQAGGNLWLASAQDGKANACSWALTEMIYGIGYRDQGLARARECLDVLARMLAYGAHLDGVADPVGHALAKANEAETAENEYSSEHFLPLLGSLSSRIEQLALSDLLIGRGPANAPAERKRARL